MKVTDAVELTERTFSLAEGKRVDVRHTRGTVTILPGEASTVRVAADTPVGLRWEMSVDENGDILVHSTSETDAPPANCTLYLPPAARLRVHLLEGVLRLQGGQVRARLDTVSAEISMRAVQGVWHLQTVSGDIHAHELRGGLYVQTVSGNVHLHACALSEMQGHALNGDFMLETTLGEGPYTFHTLDGDVILRLPADAHCDVHFHTLSGRLEIAHSGIYFPPEHAHRHIMLGDGGPQVNVHTLSGGLWMVEAPAEANTNS